MKKKDETFSDTNIERFEYSPLSQTARKLLNNRIRKSKINTPSTGNNSKKSGGIIIRSRRK